MPRPTQGGRSGGGRGGRKPMGDRGRKREGRGGNRFGPPIRQKRALGRLDFKDAEAVSRFLTEKGKILPRRITKLSAKDQRRLTNTIKRARHAAVIAFTKA